MVPAKGWWSSSSAEVSVTLRNTGRDAYKQEEYGEAVTVDLRLTRDGLRTYKLKSQAGNSNMSTQRHPKTRS